MPSPCRSSGIVKSSCLVASTSSRSGDMRCVGFELDWSYLSFFKGNRIVQVSGVKWHSEIATQVLYLSPLLSAEKRLIKLLSIAEANLANFIRRVAKQFNQSLS